MLLLYLGFFVYLIGAIGYLVAAFRTSIWWGLGCLLILPVYLVFLFVHWGVARNPFFLQIMGIGIMLLGGYLHENAGW